MGEVWLRLSEIFSPVSVVKEILDSENALSVELEAFGTTKFELSDQLEFCAVLGITLRYVVMFSRTMFNRVVVVSGLVELALSALTIFVDLVETVEAPMRTVTTSRLTVLAILLAVLPLNVIV